MKAFKIALLATLVAVASQAAQATTLIDTDLNVPDYLQGMASFSLTGPETLSIDGAALSSPDVEGIGFLELDGLAIDSLPLTNGSSLASVSSQLTLSTPGSYTFVYDYMNTGVTTGNTVSLDVSVTAAPEIDPSAALAGLMLFAGSVLVLRGRRS